ncbi:YwmB family TATA-box binding protein [Amphibacillus jilinensis]|uniref:YwmB family TATA-box binding protein n=1 Tax=Amphibacillus jilinensis TaxID=1216008 RepID=UPI0002E43A3D|nr:YwmB family TATA-box binding protein [Amphibacillus jilinensis]
MSKVIIQSLIAVIISHVLFLGRGETALHELINFADAYQYQIETGELLIKESISFETFEKIKSFIEETGFLHSDQSKEKYVRMLSPNITEELTIVKSRKQQQLMLNYHLSGDVVELFENKDLYNQFKSLIGTIYTNNMHNYACVQLTGNGIIDGGYFFEKLQSDLMITEVNRLVEEDFIVVSGLSDQFKSEIPVEDAGMNVQIASRIGRDGETTFTIGTPILTTEY